VPINSNLVPIEVLFQCPPMRPGVFVSGTLL
jgi:hypothetical protein